MGSGRSHYPTLWRPASKANNISSQPGELTTTGRTTTRALGTRLRHLYINQLHFLPDTLTSAHDVTLRSTPIQRALESVQQTYTGLYPPTKRASTLPNPTIVARAMGEETLFPNTGACKRFAELFEAFADRAAKRWNGSEELAYINSKIGKWMPLEGTQPGRVRVDGKPRLSGVMDTINASKAHGETTRLPKEFYDEQVLKNIDKIACDEWYDGFRESLEYRKLGMGALMGDMCTRMVWHAERIVRDEQSSSSAGTVEDEDTTRADPKLLLAGAHDTTLAGILASLGAFGGGSWPPFTSHVAIELFSTKPSSSASTSTPTSVKSWWNSLSPFTSSSSSASSIAKKPTSDSTPSDRAILKDHYVRIRYNDVPALIPGCAKPGRHLEGDKSFCTLEAFKAIVEDVAPKNWKRECRMNLGQSAIPEKVERAGYVVGDAELEE